MALLVLAAVFGTYGLYQLAAPVDASGWWPWPVDAFHGRIYSAVFFTGMAGCLVVARTASRLERLGVGVLVAVLGVASAANAAAADVSRDRIAWSEAGTVAWFASCLLLAAGAAVLSGRKDDG